MKTSSVGAMLFHGKGQTGGQTDRQTDGRTKGQTENAANRQKADRHDESNSRISQFCERT